VETLVSWINRLILRGGDALAWLWDGVATLFAAVFTALDAVLNPVLSPVLGALNPVFTWLGDAIYLPLGLLPPWLGLILLSALAGAAMLPVFKRLSNQAAISRAKDDIEANLLALKLFKDEIGVVLATQGRLLWAILRLQRYVLAPVLVTLPVMLPVLAQMGIRYQWRPLRPGEVALVRARLDESREAADVVLQAPEGVAVEAGPVPGGGEIVWRVRAVSSGRHALRFVAGDQTIEKELVTGEAVQRTSAVRPGREWTSQLLHPAERPLAPDAPVHRIEISYPDLDSWVYGTDLWIVTFIVVSLVVALVLRPVFKVRF